MVRCSGRKKPLCKQAKKSCKWRKKKCKARKYKPTLKKDGKGRKIYIRSRDGKHVVRKTVKSGLRKGKRYWGKPAKKKARKSRR